MATFPSLKMEKAMIKLHFHRTRNENNFILATAFCDQNNSRQAQQTFFSQKKKKLAKALPFYEENQARL